MYGLLDAILFGVALAGVTTLIAVALWKSDTIRKAAIAFIMGALLFGVYTVTNGEEVGVVSVVFYENDACIIDFSSENDLFSERGDLMPGDVVSWDGENLTLVSQGDEPWYEIVDEGDPIAAFLYPEDAAWIKETIER